MIGDTLIRISQAAVIIRLHPMEWGGNILGKGIDVPFPCDSGGLRWLLFTHPANIYLVTHL